MNSQPTKMGVAQPSTRPRSSLAPPSMITPSEPGTAACRPMFNIGSVLKSVPSALGPRVCNVLSTHTLAASLPPSLSLPPSPPLYPGVSITRRERTSTAHWELLTCTAMYCLTLCVPSIYNIALTPSHLPPEVYTMALCGNV